jgi:LysR family transcriptional regulator, hypochlorite-specific transcription factor HypT
LALAFFPNWMHQIQAHVGPMRTRLTALNVHDAVMRLAEGTCDLLVAFHHDAHPIQLDAQRYEMLVLGRETIAPYVKPDEQGRPMYTLPGAVDGPVPYLGYGQGAYLGHIVATLIKQMPVALHLNKMYETDMAESLKAMALQGHGIAFLPLSAVQAELNAGKLIAAVDANSTHSIELSFDIRLYREKPSRQDESKRSAQLLWNYLLAHDAARSMHFLHNAV